MVECYSPLPLEGGGVVRRRRIAAFPRKAEAPQGPDMTQSWDAAYGGAFAVQRPILSPFGQLLPKEGACVTFYAVRPMERAAWCWEISRLRFAALEMTGRRVP